MLCAVFSMGGTDSCQAQKRGVVANNPNRGKLAAQLEANKAAPRVPEPREEARLVVSACPALAIASAKLDSYRGSHTVGLIALVAEAKSIYDASVCSGAH